MSGKHRAEKAPIPWKFYRAYLKNRWYGFILPDLRIWWKTVKQNKGWK